MVGHVESINAVSSLHAGPIRQYEGAAMYISGTLGKKVNTQTIQAYADWFGLTVNRSRPLPKDQVGFVIEADAIRLEVPGRKAQLWHPGLAYRRIKHKNDALRKALILHEGDTVLDCTLGMGHDALAMADAGATVYGIEIQAPVLMYTLTGMWRYNARLAKRIHARRIDYREYLKSCPDKHYDHVYLDPMFPQSDIERTNVAWSMLRSFTPPDERLSRVTLEEALRVARQHVLLKLAPGERPPAYDGLAVAEKVGSKRQTYARWRASSFRSVR
jgi:16S rRNA (guanine1516-N2)-methyltransferase